MAATGSKARSRTPTKKVDPRPCASSETDGCATFVCNVAAAGCDEEAADLVGAGEGSGVGVDAGDEDPWTTSVGVGVTGVDAEVADGIDVAAAGELAGAMGWAGAGECLGTGVGTGVTGGAGVAPTTTVATMVDGWIVQ